MQKLATKNQSNSTSARTNIAKILQESAKIAIFSVTAFLYIALTSYNRLDNGWSSTGYEMQIYNAAGYAGAIVADWLLSIFGYIAYLLPTYAAVVSYQALKASSREPKSLAMISLETVGRLSVIVAACAIFSLVIHVTDSHLPNNSGGILGDFIAFAVMDVFNLIGALVVFITMFLVGITFAYNLSWSDITKILSKHTITFINYSGSWLFKQLSWLVKNMQVLFKYLKTTNSPGIPVASKPVGVSNMDIYQTQKIVSSAPKMPISQNQKISSIEKPKASLEKDTSKANPIITEPSMALNTEAGQSLPSLSLLDTKKAGEVVNIDKAIIDAVSREVEQKLSDFGIKAEVVGVQPGPVVTRFELELAPGIKASKVTALAKDLARSLSVISVRVVEVIPGKTYVGLEIPNNHRETVLLSEVLATDQYKQTTASLSLALGKDISGYPVIVDLARMPHLLVAGTTGSGKSVGINTMLISLLYKSSPEDVRLILVDPKMLELSVYEDIPHLLAPVVTDMKEAANALRWCVAEMERRYSLMSQLGVRNISGYNKKVAKTALTDEHGVLLDKFPHIVIVIDEFADMMMVVGKKVEQLIARLAQKARAAGIHMILATQRPSVDVITGLIKSNIPTRIAYQVSSRIDSRTILDQQGAEQLLGHGDMLYLPPGLGAPIRVHGAYVTDNEVHKVAESLKAQGKPEYISDIVNGLSAIVGDNEAQQDDLYQEAVEFVRETKKVSVSSIQRKFRIGYNRAASIVEAMEANSVVTPMETNGSRDVLI